MSRSDPDRAALHKDLIRRLYREFVDRGNLEAAAQIIAPEFTTAATPLRGLDAAKAIVLPVHEAFPDAHHALHDLVAEGDRVAVRWTMEATHRGSFAGIPATGKRVTYGAIVLFRFHDGKIFEQWAQVDRLGLMQQLGIIPRAAHT